MSKRFSGTIDVDIRDSQPDWKLVGSKVQTIESTDDISTGRVIFGASFRARGRLDADHGNGVAVTEDYPGERPYAFTGGTIVEAVVDVSGEEYVDLEREALAMMKRE